jgi:hypothetical protein
MWKTGDIVENRVPKVHSVLMQNWCFRALYFSTLLWITISVIVGRWVEMELIRLIDRVR